MRRRCGSFPCLEGGTHSRTSGSSIYPGGAETCCWRHGRWGLGRQLTTLYLLFEKEAEAALGPSGGDAFVCDLADWLSAGEVLVRSGAQRWKMWVFADRWGEKWADA